MVASHPCYILHHRPVIAADEGTPCTLQHTAAAASVHGSSTAGAIDLLPRMTEPSHFASYQSLPFSSAMVTPDLDRLSSRTLSQSSP